MEIWSSFHILLSANTGCTKSTACGLDSSRSWRHRSFTQEWSGFGGEGDGFPLSAKRAAKSLVSKAVVDGTLCSLWFNCSHLGIANCGPTLFPSDTICPIYRGISATWFLLLALLIQSSLSAMFSLICT